MDLFDSIGGVFTQISHWVWRILKLNLIWWLHIVMGGVILGVFPATFALFYTVRHWVEGDLNISLWKNFNSYYRANFCITNGLGWIYSCIGLFIVWDIYLVSQLKGFLPFVCLMAIAVVAVHFIIASLNIFAYYVYVEASFMQYLLQPIRISFCCFRTNLCMVMGLALIAFLVYRMPGLIPFAAGVMPAFWIMKVCMNNYKKMAREQRKGDALCNQN